MLFRILFTNQELNLDYVFWNAYLFKHISLFVFLDDNLNRGIYRFMFLLNNYIFLLFKN